MPERGVSWREFRDHLRDQESERQRTATQRDTDVRRRLHSGLGTAKKPKGILRWNNLPRPVPKEHPPKGHIDINNPRHKINPKKKFYHEDEVLNNKNKIYLFILSFIN